MGLFGIALVLARVAAAAGAGRRRVWLAGIAFGLAWVPVGALSPAGYVRGVTGDLSVTSIVLLAVSITGWRAPGERKVLSAAVLAGAVFLYPMALGLGGFDPYRLGFAPHVLLPVLCVGAGLAWLRQRYLALACIVLAVTGHSLALMESTNLWDYLLDPWIALVSIYDLRPLRRKT